MAEEETKKMKCRAHSISVCVCARVHVCVLFTLCLLCGHAHTLNNKVTETKGLPWWQTMLAEDSVCFSHIM